MKKIIKMSIISLSVSVTSLTQINEYKIIPSDGSEISEFGSSVSISGDYAVIGAPISDENSNYIGSAYVFRRNGTAWIEEQKLTPSEGNASDLFGGAVCISDEVIIIGATLDENNGDHNGAAYIFRKDSLSSVWIEEDKLTAFDGYRSDNFGGSVSISGDIAVIGSKWDDDNGEKSGSAYIYIKDGSDWTLEQKLTASDAAERDWFGCSVSICEETIIIGAWRDDDNEMGSGSAYIFRRDSISVLWKEVQKLTASDSHYDGRFGFSVSLSSNHLIVGAQRGYGNDYQSGSAYIFKLEGTNWLEEQKLIATDGVSRDQYGNSVSILGDYAIIGANRRNNYTGAIYIYGRKDSSWTELHRITPSDAVQNDFFGYSVAISIDNAIAGAALDFHNGEQSGSAYMYENFVITEIDIEQSETISTYILNQNYPNPFNPNTKIKYQIKQLSFVSINVYDILGNDIAILVNDKKPAGTYEVDFDATNLPSGIYFYRLQVGNFVETKKMVLMK